MTHRLVRIGFGIVLILHGLAHAVLPLRGFGMDTDAGWNGFAILLYATAVIGFVSAGLGILGARGRTAARWRGHLTVG